MRYSYCLRFGDGAPHGEWLVTDTRGRSLLITGGGKIVFRLPYLSAHDDAGEPPAELRAEYERLNADEIAATPKPSMPNLVETIAGDDQAWDQPCYFGHRIESHAVYCHNEAWLYSPRKCRRGGDWPHSECPGFRPRVDPIPGE